MKLLTEDAGKFLAEELQTKIHTARYTDAYNMVDDLLKELEARDKEVLIQPWMTHVRKLEKQIEEQQKQIDNLRSKGSTDAKVLTTK